MKKFVAAGLLLLASVTTVDAQTVADTLDNRRYYPLEVGNEWQYTTIAFITPIPSWTRERITGDTLVDGERYFKRLSEHFGPETNYEHVEWLRYNDVGAVLAFPDLEADTTDQDSATYWYHADFGDTLEGDFGDEYVGGGYDESFYLYESGEVEVAAIKTLQVPDPLQGISYYTTAVYAADFGRVAEAFFDGPTTDLSYARIGGVEYGTPPITVGGEWEEVQPQRHLAVYPNPARHTVTLEFEPSPSADVHLCDLLGRCFASEALAGRADSDGNVQLDVSDLSAGIYLLMVTRDGGSRETRVLTVVR